MAMAMRGRLEGGRGRGAGPQMGCRFDMSSRTLRRWVDGLRFLFPFCSSFVRCHWIARSCGNFRIFLAL